MRLTILWVLALNTTLSLPTLASEIIVRDAWARPTLSGNTNGVAYAIIENHETSNDRLIGISTPVAERSELHSHTVEDGVMKMRPITSGIELPPGARISFEPGGLHFMFFGMIETLSLGDVIPLDLEFLTAGKITVNAIVATKPSPSTSMKMEHH